MNNTKNDLIKLVGKYKTNIQLFQAQIVAGTGDENRLLPCIMVYEIVILDLEKVLEKLGVKKTYKGFNIDPL